MLLKVNINYHQKKGTDLFSILSGPWHLIYCQAPGPHPLLLPPSFVQFFHANFIKLASPPVDNEANKQCCEFIAKQLGIARRQVAIIRGQTSRHKVLRIEGVVEQEVQEKLLRKDR